MTKNTDLTTAERFWSKVQGGDYTECWTWTASLNAAGYGQFCPVRGTMTSAHRWGYKHMVGPIPEGLQLDHLCSNPACVNPWHLDPVTPLVNTRRSAGNANKTHCKHGHEFTPENTHYEPKRQHRMCRTCARARDRERYPERYQRQKAERSSLPEPGPSLYRGVTWDRSNQGWVVRIRVSGERKFIGRFHDEEEAAHAYTAAVAKWIS